MHPPVPAFNPMAATISLSGFSGVFGLDFLLNIVRGFIKQGRLLKKHNFLQNVSNRKKNKRLERRGLSITRTKYENHRVFTRASEDIEADDVFSSQILDVTCLFNFLVTDSGQLKLCKGIKKSGLMGLCDPCPEEPKQLLVEYTYAGYKIQGGC